MYRTIIFATLFAVWSCASTHGTSTNEVVTADPADHVTGVESSSLQMDELPVVDIAATAGFDVGTVCDDRPPPGSRIRRMRCYDKTEPKLGLYEFMSLPDGLKPAATMLPPR